MSSTSEKAPLDAKASDLTETSTTSSSSSSADATSPSNDNIASDGPAWLQDTDLALLGNGQGKELNEEQVALIRQLYEKVEPLRTELSTKAREATDHQHDDDDFS